MVTDEQREFLSTHRLCVVGVPRAKGGPSLSPVYYVMDDDDLLISTTASRAKGRIVERSPGIEVSVCVLHEQPPFPYLTVIGRAKVEHDGAAALMRRIGEAMTGSTIGDDVMPMIEERAKSEGRVVLRVTPSRFVSTRPRG